MGITPEKVLDALRLVIEPDLKKDLVSLGMIQNLEVKGQEVSFTVVLTTPACPLKDAIKNACIQAVHEHVAADAVVHVELTARVSSKRADDGPMLAGVKNIIAVASGKGGVGKSTVSANLAVALARSGARVGLVDADIYGPSVPLMFDAVGATLDTVEENGRAKVLPLRRYGVDVMSIGFFVDASKALIWRGPMAAGAMKQMFTDVQWGELDYMIIDLPPGTGDIHLSLVQSVELTGAVVVSTPQQVALADAHKAVAMFANSNINVKILGFVENMAWFTPAELPGSQYFIFGREGCKALAQELELPFLGQIPLIQEICESGDSGKPAILNPEHPAGPYFEAIAQKLAQQVSIENARKLQEAALAE